MVETEYAKSLKGKIAIRALLTVIAKQGVILASNIVVVMEEFVEVISAITIHILAPKYLHLRIVVETMYVKEQRTAAAAQ